MKGAYKMPLFRKKKLAICYIVKNSILRLPKSYQIMRQLSDGIIVIDTGSTDGTCEWVESRSDAQLEKFKWIDDFSAARNYAISKIDSEYILMIDDDEYIPKKAHKKFKEYFTGLREKPVFSFYIANYLQPYEFFEKPKYLEGLATRLFPNNKGIKYKHLVHEVLIHKQENKLMTIPIFHEQYRSFPVIESKMKHRRELIYKNLKDNKPEFRDYIHLANTYRECFRINGLNKDLNSAIVNLNAAYSLKKDVRILEEIKSLERVRG